MTAEDPAELQARADAGDVAAMVAFGMLLLGREGPGRHIPGGAHYIAQAASHDDPEALAQLAVLVAAGVANAPSWERAFDHLQRAAELGWAPAQEQLRFLARREGNDFAALRQSIDMDAWMKPPETSVVSEKPRLLTARRLMSGEECARVITRARGKLHRASVYDPATGVHAIVDERSNSTAEITLIDIDLPMLFLHARMSNMLGLPSQFFELTNILHYEPGQRFKPHFDYLATDEPGLGANVQALGQRIVTLLVYLNADYEGGETRFPRLNYAFKGGVGDALMFGNVSEKGVPDPLTLHEGTPPLSGEKWLLSQWVRDRPPLAAPAATT